MATKYNKNHIDSFLTSCKDVSDATLRLSKELQKKSQIEGENYFLRLQVKLLLEKLSQEDPHNFADRIQGPDLTKNAPL
jgi:hypothetical protein